MTILGIDPSSTKIGLAVLTPGCNPYAQIHTIDVSKLKLTLSTLTQTIAAKVISWIDMTIPPEIQVGERYPNLIAIEEPFVQYPRAALPIAWICGGLAVAFGQTEVIAVSHMSWKRALTGRGNADKEAVMKMLLARGYDCPDEHSASALGVALYALSRRDSG